METTNELTRSFKIPRKANGEGSEQPELQLKSPLSAPLVEKKDEPPPKKEMTASPAKRRIDTSGTNGIPFGMRPSKRPMMPPDTTAAQPSSSGGGGGDALVDKIFADMNNRTAVKPLPISRQEYHRLEKEKFDRERAIRHELRRKKEGESKNEEFTDFNYFKKYGDQVTEVYAGPALTRKNLEQHMMKQNDFMALHFSRSENLMRRLLGYKMINNRIDTYNQMGYIKIDPMIHKIACNEDDDDPLPGPDPDFADQADSSQKKGPRGPKTPPGSPPAGPRTPPPPPDASLSTPVKSQRNVILDHVASLVGGTAEQVDSFLGADLERAMEAVDKDKLLETLRMAFRSALPQNGEEKRKDSDRPTRDDVSDQMELVSDRSLTPSPIDYRGDSFSTPLLAAPPPPPIITPPGQESLCIMSYPPSSLLPPPSMKTFVTPPPPMPRGPPVPLGFQPHEVVPKVYIKTPMQTSQKTVIVHDPYLNKPPPNQMPSMQQAPPPPPPPPPPSSGGVNMSMPPPNMSLPPPSFNKPPPPMSNMPPSTGQHQTYSNSTSMPDLSAPPPSFPPSTNMEKPPMLPVSIIENTPLKNDSWRKEPEVRLKLIEEPKMPVMLDERTALVNKSHLNTLLPPPKPPVQQLDIEAVTNTMFSALFGSKRTPAQAQPSVHQQESAGGHQQAEKPSVDKVALMQEAVNVEWTSSSAPSVPISFPTTGPPTGPPPFVPGPGGPPPPLGYQGGPPSGYQGPPPPMGGPPPPFGYGGPMGQQGPMGPMDMHGGPMGPPPPHFNGGIPPLMGMDTMPPRTMNRGGRGGRGNYHGPR